MAPATPPYAVVCDTVIPTREYNQLRKRAELADVADTLLTDLMQQLANCEANRLAIYTLAHTDVLEQQRLISQQRLLQAVSRPLTVTLPPPVITSKTVRIPFWLWLSVGVASGWFIHNGL